MNATEWKENLLTRLGKYPAIAISRHDAGELAELLTTPVLGEAVDKLEAKLKAAHSALSLATSRGVHQRDDHSINCEVCRAFWAVRDAIDAIAETRLPPREPTLQEKIDAVLETHPRGGAICDRKAIADDILAIPEIASLLKGAKQ